MSFKSVAALLILLQKQSTIRRGILSKDCDLNQTIQSMQLHVPADMKS